MRVLIAVTALTGLLTCKKQAAEPAAAGGAAPGAGALTVGFIYVGPKDDWGYNQAHAEGAAAVAKLEGIKVREEENVPETAAVQKTMESMVSLDGAQLLFPTSFGYFDPHIIKTAEKFKETPFLHCGGLYVEGKHPGNVGSYFGYIDEAQYVAGVVAGMTTKKNKLGFIAAKPIPQVLRNINSFTLGARSVNPKVTTSVVFTGDWSMPVKEAEAANSLADQGVDVLTMHVDSPKVVVETAERRGDLQLGLPRQPVGPGPQGVPHGRRVELGQDLHRLHRHGAGEEVVPPPAARRLQGRLRQAVALRLGGERGRPGQGRGGQGPAQRRAPWSSTRAPSSPTAARWSCPRAPQQNQTDIVLEKMDYLVEGVIGKIPS